jgi:uncharacterized membrane protein
MNLHPIFVHFPIALLTIYALLEVFIPLKVKVFKVCKWQNTKLYALLVNPIWKHIKAFLVIFGAVTVIPTLLTGEVAEHKYVGESNPQVFFQSDLGKLIEAHGSAATVSVIIFSILALMYLASYFEKTQKLFSSTYVRMVLSIVGLLCITITGALGGAISHGPDTDPVVTFVYNLVLGK